MPRTLVPFCLAASLTASVVCAAGGVDDRGRRSRWASPSPPGSRPAAPRTITLPVIAGCRPHTNAYVPGSANVHSPCQPLARGAVGRPVHEDGFVGVKPTLW